MEQALMNKTKLIIKTLEFRKVPIGLIILLLTLGLFILMIVKVTGNRGLLLILLGILIFFLFYVIQIKSLVIDLTKRKINVYLKSIFKNSEKTYSLNEFLALRIEFSIGRPQNKVKSSFGVSPYWGKVQYKSFDLYLIAENKSLKVKHFTDASKAKSFQKELANYIDKPILKPIRILTKY